MKTSSLVMLTPDLSFTSSTSLKQENEFRVQIWIQWGSEIWPFKIWKHLKSGLFEGQISNGSVFKWSGFVWISNDFWQNGGHLSGFKMVGLPDFSFHPKSGPFATQPLLDHSKSRLVRISDPHSSTIPLNGVRIWILDKSECQMVWLGKKVS